MLYRQARALEIDTSIQITLLEWVLFSSGILRLNQLANILDLSFPSLGKRGASKTTARSACSPLLEILEDETVQVIHHSFTEFLLDPYTVNSRPTRTITPFPVLDSEEVHKRLAGVLLSSLQSGVLLPTIKAEASHVTHVTPTTPCNCDEDED